MAIGGWYMNTGYRIGAVSRLTGISTDTIRAWERRYSVVQPNRGENNNRYYTGEHIRRLLSIKRLVDAGQAIGTICQLSDEELSERTNGLLGVDKQISCRNWLVLSIHKPGWLTACMSAHSGNDLSNRPSSSPPSPTSNNVTYCSDFEDLSRQLQKTEFEFIVVDMPSLSEAHEKVISKTITGANTRRCLVVYQYASRHQLRGLSNLGFRLLKGPLEPFALANLLDGPAESVTSRQYTKRQLNKASELSSMQSCMLTCEAMKHLSELIIGLNQLEDYMADYQNPQAEDAALYQRIRAHTCKARSMLELALRELTETKGLSLKETLQEKIPPQSKEDPGRC